MPSKKMRLEFLPELSSAPHPHPHPASPQDTLGWCQ